jgi:predicted phage-related endonuclease
MLTETQRIARKSHVGASDVAALFGLDPFKTASDVWLTKAFDVASETKQSDSIDIGNDLEAPLVSWAARELGVTITVEPDDLFRICLSNPIFSAALDAKILFNVLPTQRGEAIEAKTTSVTDEWGEPGSDAVPDRVNLQCQAQCLCHDLGRVYVVVLMGKHGLKRELYHVNRNEKIIDAIIQKGTSFWNDYVLTKIPPPPDEFGLGSLEIIKRVQRVPQTWAVVPDELIIAWDEARSARLAAEKVEKDALSRMLTPLGDAEGVQMSDGRTLCYFPTVKKILDQARIKSEYPDIYAVCQKESTSRTPRIKGA